jgi:hypothetical protein
MKSGDEDSEEVLECDESDGESRVDKTIGSSLLLFNKLFFDIFIIIK